MAGRVTACRYKQNEKKSTGNIIGKKFMTRGVLTCNMKGSFVDMERLEEREAKIGASMSNFSHFVAESEFEVFRSCSVRGKGHALSLLICSS
jgi:hypothetical protein